jgi:hypothetical protein
MRFAIASPPITMSDRPSPSESVRSPYSHQSRDRPKVFRLLAVVHPAFQNVRSSLDFMGFAIVLTILSDRLVGLFVITH